MRWITSCAVTVIVVFLCNLCNYRFRLNRKLHFGLVSIFSLVNYYFMVVDSGNGAIQFWLRYQIVSGNDFLAIIFAAGSFILFDLFVCFLACKFGNLGFHLAFFRKKRKPGQTFGELLEILSEAKKCHRGKKEAARKVGDENVITV